MRTKELSRKQLYDLVWSTPLSKLTLQYALSTNGIRKICKEFDIPMPDGGYWSKLKFNKKVKIEKLNPIFGGIGKIILTIREEGNPIEVDQTPLAIRTKEIENDVKAHLVVPDKITNPDILTIQTQEYWKESKGNVFYDNYKKLYYPIRVSDNQKQRALRFMDSLTKLLRYRGHTISKEYHETSVNIDGIKIEIDLREASKRVSIPTSYRSSELVPIGELIFKIGRYSRQKEWRDGKTKIEELLARIVAKLEIYAELEKTQKEETRIMQLKYKEELKQKEDIRKRRNDEVEKFNKLVALSEQYSKTILIRQYIEAEKQNALSKNILTPEKQEWINWATAKADWLDPLINKPDDIFDAG